MLPTPRPHPTLQRPPIHRRNTKPRQQAPPDHAPIPVIPRRPQRDAHVHIADGEAQAQDILELGGWLGGGGLFEEEGDCGGGAEEEEGADDEGGGGELEGG